MKCDLVLEGGGVKGIGLAGAFSSMEARGFEPENVAGASAGAITAAVIAAGYNAAEIRQIVMDMDFRDFKDGSKWKSKQFWNVARHLGIYKGDVFLQWMTELLKAKGVTSFGDLAILGEEDPRWRWKLKVIVSDITKQRLVVFPNDAALFGINPDELSVALAIRASMAIPFFFRPISMGTSWLVDGGMLSNFPIWLFDSDKKPSHPTFGMLLEGDQIPEPDIKAERAGYNRIISFGKSLVKTMTGFHDKKFIRPDDFEYRSIVIPTKDIGTTEFDITDSRRDFLFHSGKTAANEFLDDWSWPEYKKWAKRTR